MTDTTFKYLGSVISGTHRERSLIEAFLPIAREFDPKAIEAYLDIKERLTLQAWVATNLDVCDDEVRLAWDRWEQGKGAEQIGEFVHYLMDKLSYFAPDGYYFGANMGDGADFGFWPDADYGDDEPDEGIEDPPESLAERLWAVTMDGTCRDGGGVEHSVGWYALIEDYEDHDYVLRQDSNGNKTIEGPFDEVEIDPSIGGGYYSPAKRRMDELDAEYNAILDADEDDEDDDPLMAQGGVLVMTLAREWIEDCATSSDEHHLDIVQQVASMDDERVKRIVSKHYEGGWSAFLGGCEPA